MPHIYAIGDLHLSHAVSNKAMDVFGSRWKDHADRLREAWQATVGADDLVLIPGDISWAMHLSEARADLEYLDALNGRKLLLRGNHDYWWQSATKLRAILPESVSIVQNDAFCFGGYCICGTRGWVIPESNGFQESADRKIYERELGRLQLTLSRKDPDRIGIVMLHYPPFAENGVQSAFVTAIEEAGIRQVVYGHLHGKSHRTAFEGSFHGVEYHLVSADYLDFIPKRIV